MRRDECVRCMCCVPDLRASVLRWFERRGYGQVSMAPFPEGLTDGFSRPAELVVVAKNLPAASNDVDREGTLFNDSSVEGGTSCGSGDGGSMEVAAKQKQGVGRLSRGGKHGASMQEPAWVFGEPLPPESRTSNTADASAPPPPPMPPPRATSLSESRSRAISGHATFFAANAAAAAAAAASSSTSVGQVD